MPNVEALRETMDAVLAHQDQWDQTAWIRETDCGTVGCFAGWRAILDGYTPEDVERCQTRAVNADGLTVFVKSHAQYRLGLTDDQADDLFDQDNTLADLKRIVDELCDGAS